MIGTWYWKIPKVKVKSPLTPFPLYAAFVEHWNPGLKCLKCQTRRRGRTLHVLKLHFTNCFVIFSIYIDKIIFYRHYCCYAGDCSPRLHVTLGHSGEPGESNGCSERAARSLLLIIILILNTTACVAVVEMVRFFSVEKHFLLTVTLP